MNTHEQQAKKSNLGEMITSFYSWLSTSPTGRQCLFFVVVPVLLISCYLVALSPDRYVSGASILVKETGVTQMQTGILGGLGFNASGPTLDEQLLKSFIVSPNMLNLLDEQLQLRNHYSQSRDFIFGLNEADSYEDFIKFFRKHVHVGPDSDTGLLTISVQAYSPDFSKKLADALLRHSEKFVNEASQNIAKREMQFALDEITRSQELLKAANVALQEFQNEYSLISPDSEGESLVSIVFQLEGELAQTEAAIKQGNSYLNSDAPQLIVLISKADALRDEIDAQKQRIAGSSIGDNKLNELSAQFQSLALDVELATTLYTSALNAYELARVQAGKQLKHLIIASQPQLPEEALYPKRLYWLITWVILLVIVWGVVRMILISSREHQD